MNDYFAPAVGWALASGVTNGTDATHFSPGEDCTRAQTLTFLWRAAGCPEPQSGENPFKDVDEDAYYYKAVLWAAEQGITKGTGPDSFSSGAPVSCAQTITLLYRAFGGGSADETEGAAYYENALRWAEENGITLASDGIAFDISADCLRAQIITVLWRACGGR